ncbi:tripartite tricarboxylate transporter TctB family protein [uncultured Cohaesibacter sp.]|uniref:tripartite tricarboxylate transporter TctB family protein n=1 Tax=uncultured Cohaesibacter sp. TaxID=1002546 RepID=UPI00292F79FA|nr:tripartite tricarboxylate transporter TctB family protein [uncultured Cohaesibacter sp.]
MSKLKQFTGAGLLFPIFLFCLTTVYLVATFNIRTMFGADGGVGPKTMPVVSAIIMYVALLRVIMTEFLKTEPEEKSFQSHLRPIGVAIATGGYILFFVPLGYWLSTFVFVAALFLIFKFQTKRPLLFIVYDLAITAAFFGLFAGLFSVRLPTLTGGIL